MVIEPRVVQFWSEIILVISNRTRAARSFDFEITRMISAQIALHAVQLPLLIRSSHIRFLYIHSYFCFVVKNLGCENLREISKLLWPKTKSKVTIPFTKYSETSPRSLLRHGKCANLGTLSRTRRMPWFTAVRLMWSVWPPP